jgi:hypothetical protein
MRPALALALLCLAGCASAQFSTSGYAAADGRVFVQPAKYPGQDQGTGVSLVVEPSFKLDLKDGAHTFRLTPFYRLDPNDERRSHADLRELSYRYSGTNLEFLAGVSTVTWGVLEAHRPVDVVNQHDFVESLSDTAKLGQPMVELAWLGEAMAVRAYLLPYFRDETFGGVRGRLRFPVPIDVEHPQFESALGRWHPAGALRWTFNVGDFDFGASVFSGSSREPRFIVELTSGQVVPRYDVSQQASADAQWTVGAFTLKAEGFVRLWTNQFRPFGGAGLGFDYTFFKFIREADLTLVAEGFYDSRPVDAPVTFFDHDVFAGFRLAINDVSNTEVSGGAIVDLLDGTVIARVDASRRFGDHWRLSLGINAFVGSSSRIQASFNKDSYGSARIAYFF